MSRYKDTEYLNATARVRAMENTMVGSKGFVKMIDAKNAEEAFKVLTESAIGQGHDLAGYEQAFRDNLREAYDLVEKISPLPGLTDIFRYKYDGHNLKTAIKARRLQKDYSGIMNDMGTVPVASLVAGLENNDLSGLAPALAAAGLEAVEQMAKTGDPQTVDILIDKAVLESMRDKAAALGNRFVTRFTETQVDIANIRAAVRLLRMKKDLPMLKRVLVEGGTIPADRLCDAYTKGYDELLAVIASSRYGNALEESFDDLRGERSLTLFEKLCDNYVISVFDGVKYIPFGIEPLVAYLYGKECETSSARIVLASKLAGVPAPQITERLRDAYA